MNDQRSVLGEADCDADVVERKGMMKRHERRVSRALRQTQRKAGSQGRRHSGPERGYGFDRHAIEAKAPPQPAVARHEDQAMVARRHPLGDVGYSLGNTPGNVRGKDFISMKYVQDMRPRRLAPPPKRIV